MHMRMTLLEAPDTDGNVGKYHLCNSSHEQQLLVPTVRISGHKCMNLKRIKHEDFS